MSDDDQGQTGDYSTRKFVGSLIEEMGLGNPLETQGDSGELNETAFGEALKEAGLARIAALRMAGRISAEEAREQAGPLWGHVRRIYERIVREQGA